MHIIQLYGSPTCHRYQRMKTIALAEAAHLQTPWRLEEINDPGQLARFNPLSLPRLHIDGHLVASGNPPDAAQVASHLL